MSRLPQTRRTLLLCTTVSCALVAACAGADPPVVNSKLAGQIRAQYELDAGAPSNGSGGGAANAPANAVASAAGGGSAVAPTAKPADSDGAGGSAGAANPAEMVDNAEGGSGGGASTAPSSSACDGFAVLATNCGSSGCHGDGSNLENFAASETAARAFIGKPGTLACTGQGDVIDPDDPDGSLMIQKLSSDPPCGSSMPLGGSTLSKSEIECIRSWMGGL